MTAQTDKDRIISLITELNHHNYRYYVFCSPRIIDKCFDIKMKELEKLESKYPHFVFQNSPTQSPGSDCEEDYTEEEKALDL